MNSKQAKQIKITDYLNILVEKNEFFIKSPFNKNEKTPSFKINNDRNIWYDHARGEGGNIIDLVMKLQNCSLSQALGHLENSNTSFSFSSAKTTQNNIIKPEVQIKKIKDLQNHALIEYLTSRKINISQAKKYLLEIYYTFENKNYFSLAFKNDNGGYETRNAYFKGCIGSKSITTIKSSNNQIVSVFEGFMDFLSAVTFYKKIPKNDVIILNSLSMLKTLDLSKYKQICLYFDNDEAGKLKKVELCNKNNNCIDCSNIYNNYKDFNEMLVKIL